MAEGKDELNVVDPESGNVVRFTDNGAKADDFYPSYQEPKQLLLDPAGLPYELGLELRGHGAKIRKGDVGGA